MSDTMIDTRISIRHAQDLRAKCDEALTLTQELLSRRKISSDEYYQLMHALTTASGYMSYDLRRAGVEP